MPCFQSIPIKIDFTIGSKVVLQKAVQKLGWTMVHDEVNKNITVMTKSGSFILNGQHASFQPELAASVNKLRVEYGRQCLIMASDKYGMNRTITGLNKYQISKGG